MLVEENKMGKYVLNNDNYNEEMIAKKIGGKAKSLIQLKSLSINIPDFFVITTDAFKDF